MKPPPRARFTGLVSPKQTPLPPLSEAKEFEGPPPLDVYPDSAEIRKNHLPTAVDAILLDR
jgi:hypothetical protein